ncbi:MAG TPA: hypothetical protein VHU40_19070, partial [Polyangia bacterium]|nr:hypothetical protein [Polyangia bacterium]
MTRGAFFITTLRAPSMRSFVAAVLWLGLSACGYNNQPENGKQHCAGTNSSQRCPSNYYCAPDDFCWRNGTGPDGGTPIDLGGTGGTGGIVAGTGGVSPTGGTVGTGGQAQGGAPGMGGAGGSPVDAG